MSLHLVNGIQFITSKLLDRQGITHGFFMRHGGCSPHPWNSLNMATSVGDSRENVIENRARIADSLKIARSSFFDLWQVHSNKIVKANQPRKLSETHTRADGIVTDQPKIALLMLFADCVPILFFDPGKQVIAAAHAGWKGTLNGIATEVVKVMENEYHCASEDIIAIIGPSICRNHYQIGKEVIDKVENSFFDKNEILSQKNQKTYLDLSRANQINLENCGVNKIETIEICTACNTRDWFSHREENGQTGRFAVVITL